jgi:hypothetical protein
MIAPCSATRASRHRYFSSNQNIRELMLQAFDEYFAVLKQDLAVSAQLLRVPQTYIPQAARGKVSFTSDMWSTHKLHLFMAVTAHWIARENNSMVLVLKAALIVFHHVPGSHTRVSLACEMVMLLDRAEVTENLSVHFAMWHTLTSFRRGTLL